MNKERRAKLREAVKLLSAITFDNVAQIVADIREEEQEASCNLSEGLQASERGQSIAAAADALEEACDALDEMQANLETAIAKIEEACE